MKQVREGQLLRMTVGVWRLPTHLAPVCEMRPTRFWVIRQISKDIKALKKMQTLFCVIMESIRLDLSKIKNTGKSLNTWKLNNILLKKKVWLPWWSKGQESALQGTEHRLSPGGGQSHVLRGNQAQASQLLSLSSRPSAPQVKPPQWEARAPR